MEEVNVFAKGRKWTLKWERERETITQDIIREIMPGWLRLLLVPVTQPFFPFSFYFFLFSFSVI